MKTALVLAAGLAGLGAPLAVAQPEPSPFTIPAPAAPTPLPEGAAKLARVPSAFLPNLGQWEHSARFVAQLGGVAVFLEEGGFALSAAESCDEPAGAPSRGAAVRMRFAGARPCEVVGEEPLAGVHAYFLGNDPSRWRTGVPRFGAVRYRGAWPGVDVMCFAKEGHLEYDLVLSPGAALAGVELTVEGAEVLRVEEEGTLVLETAIGPLRQPRPKTFEVDGAGRRRELTARYEVRGRDRFGFVVPEWGGGSRLVLDPGLLWSTFVGGVSHEFAEALSVEASGVVTIAGYTLSADHPTTPGAWNTTHNSPGGLFTDVFVSRLDPSQPSSQQLLYSTFVGGTDSDFATALSVDASGVVTIAGYTQSANYPTTPGAWDTTHNSSTLAFVADVFVTRLDPSQPSSQQLLYSTFLGGASAEFPWALSVDASGVATIAGETTSPDYPTTPGAWDTTYNGAGFFSDVFVTRLDPSQPSSQQLLYSTFVGGAALDTARALSVDAAGVVTIAGSTNSSFPPGYPTTPGAWDTTHNGGYDVFVARLDPSQPSSQQLLYSTFVGGTGPEWVQGLSADASGVVTIAGQAGPGYPTTPGAWDTAHNSPGGPGPAFYDAFVSRLDPSQPSSRQLLYSTFVGGVSGDSPRALSVEASGVVTIAGETTSANYPTTPGAWDTTYNGSNDVFVARLDPSLPSSQQLRYSTFVGGASDDQAWALSVDASGVATIAGSTSSADYPTTPGAWDTTHDNPGFAGDAFVTRLDMLPAGASAYGASTPGCAGPLAIGVTSWPQVGNAAFAVTCASGPSNGFGFLGFSSAGLAAPLVFGGLAAWIDPFAPFFLEIVVPSNAVGAATVPLPIPPDAALAGLQLFVQFAWPDACAPGGFSASNALAIVVQP
ncbi:MAG: hypothetical protein L0323_10265 [Planctomycetes bacterium]|nr:hypothetical protein [Planctomycetota bacterium]